jgi:hypothetical protein
MSVQKPSLAMTTNLSKLADVIRMAARAYDSGKRETALKLLAIVASKIETSEDRQKLLGLVRSDIQNSGIKVYFQSIILGSGGTAVYR